MIDPLNLTQIQYELAIAIGTSLNMEQMLKEALGAILHKLGGTAIGVHWMPAQDETGAMAPFTIPRGAARSDAYASAVALLPPLGDAAGWLALGDTLPLQGGVEPSGYYHILGLPGVGVLILTRKDAPLEGLVVAALQPLLGRLADACLACRQNQALADAHQETIRVNRELTQAQQEVRELFGRNQAILDAIPDWMFTLGRNGEILDYRLTDSTSLGQWVAKLARIGKSIDDLLPAELAQQTHMAIRRALASQRRQSFEIPVLHEGETVHLEVRMVVSGADEVLAIVQDVSERKRLTEQLEVLARFSAENPNPVMRVDKEGMILFANQQSQQILDVWKSEVEGQVSPQWLQTCLGVLERGVETSLEEVVGERFYIFTIAPIVEGGYVNLYARDITERYYAEEILAQEHNLLRTLIDNLPDQIYVKDRESNFLLFNPAVLRALGAKNDEEVVGKTDFDFHSPELAAEFFADEQRILTTGQPIFNKEERIVGGNGQDYWRSTTKIPLFDQKGEVTGLIGINHDVTAAKNAADALRQAAAQNQLLAQAVDAASDGVLITDARHPDNPIIYANPAFTRITGYSTQEVLGRNYRFLQGPETDPAELAKLRRAIAEERSVAISVLNYRKDGRIFWNELAISPVFSDEGELTHFVGVQTDSSERRQTARTLQAVLDTIYYPQV